MDMEFKKKFLELCPDMLVYKFKLKQENLISNNYYPLNYNLIKRIIYNFTFNVYKLFKAETIVNNM